MAWNYLQTTGLLMIVVSSRHWVKSIQGAITAAITIHTLWNPQAKLDVNWAVVSSPFKY